ncbi:MFS transporter [Sulfitobacter sp.]|uniref:MFS transporter n=1 Tax=Sulfitobacter sp. TaxID=1903071 RepID=UPI003002A567
MFETSRATVSLIYSFSLVFLTTAVWFGPAVYSRLQPATIYIWVALLGAVGAGIAGTGSSVETVLIGYSLIFGIANGLGYGFGLQFAARANPDHSGLAMGVVTAAYALGAVLAPYGFEVALAFGGFVSAMTALGSAVIFVGIGAPVLVARSGVQYSSTKADSNDVSLPWGRIVTIWVAYGSCVFAGLMAIGHAAGISETAGYSGWIAAAAIAGCNLVGSLLSGWLSDRVSHRFILTILPLLSAVALLALSVFPSVTIPLLGVVGFAYGGTIATYPAAIAILFSGENGAHAYGRVFTAWGVAGLLAPWLAGQTYDWGGGYTAALWIAAGLGIMSAITARKIIW